MKEIEDNKVTILGEQQESNQDDPNLPILPRKYISYMDNSPITPLLAEDFEKPLLHEFVQYEGFGLSLWGPFDRKPKTSANEHWICVLDGSEEFRIVSPVYRQNIYSGVLDHLHPAMLPKDITFFDIDAEKYPLMAEIEDHILTSTLEKGDCIYVPSLHWIESRTLTEEAMLVTFTFKPASDFITQLFTAIDDGGILDY